MLMHPHQPCKPVKCLLLLRGINIQLPEEVDKSWFDDSAVILRVAVSSEENVVAAISKIKQRGLLLN